MKLEWEKTKEESYKAGYRNMLRKTFVLPSGETAGYDIFDEEKAVHMVALTPDNMVILERVFRPGPERVILDLPAGYIDENETPEEAAIRELLEETGMEGEVELAGTSIDDAYRNTVRYTYVIRNCRRTQEPELGDDEFIEIVEMPINEFKKHLRSGSITHAEVGYIALDHLNLL